MTNLLQLTIKVRKSHRRPQDTLQLVCEGRVFFVFVELRGCLCGQQHPNWNERFVSCSHLSSINFALHPTPQTKIQKFGSRDSKCLIR